MKVSRIYFDSKYHVKFKFALKFIQQFVLYKNANIPKLGVLREKSIAPIGLITSCRDLFLPEVVVMVCNFGFLGYYLFCFLLYYLCKF